MNATRETKGEKAQRLDLWLWFARFFKSRTLATRFVQSGRLRVNEKPVKKAHYNVRTGDILTFPTLDRILVIEILSLGTRRGPAIEARTLDEDLFAIQGPTAPPKETSLPPPGSRPPGSGRPTKRQRRALDRLRTN